MQRIAIIGSAGAGKSTLARQLGERLGLEVIHLDRLYWRPGWEPTPREEWIALQQGLVERPSWIIDGNYGSTLDLRLEAAEMIIFLDLPRRLCLWRAVRRYLSHRGGSRPDLNPGCPEQIDLEFLRWIWHFPQKGRLSILAKLAAYRERKRVVQLQSTRAVAGFLAEIGLHDEGGHRYGK